MVLEGFPVIKHVVLKGLGEWKEPESVNELLTSMLIIAMATTHGGRSKQRMPRRRARVMRNAFVQVREMRWSAMRLNLCNQG